jgi:hypothetical protein
LLSSDRPLSPLPFSAFVARRHRFQGEASENTGMTDGIRIIRHERVKDSGSFEVRFPDGRREFFYWDNGIPPHTARHAHQRTQALEQARAPTGGAR